MADISTARNCHLLTNCQIIDVIDGKFVAHPSSIWIDNGRIHKVLDSKEQIPNEAPPVLDLQDKFILPGVIDCHVHETDYRQASSPLLKKSPASYVAARSLQHLRDILQRTGTIGVLAEGATADLLVVDENPLLSNQAFDDWNIRCQWIFKEGKLCYERTAEVEVPE